MGIAREAHKTAAGKASGDLDDGFGGPFRSPAHPQFLFFSEGGRSVVSCLQLNGSQGLFVGPTIPRISALAVVEALDRDGLLCGVRIIGRVLEKFAHPAPLIRVGWARAVSALPPNPFLDVFTEFYGFLLRNPPHPGLEAPYGCEYDFERHSFQVRTLDSARGDDPTRYGVAGDQLAHSARLHAMDQQLLDEQSATRTQMIPIVRH